MYLVAGLLFFGGALILQSAQTGGVGVLQSAPKTPTAHHGARQERSEAGLASCASGVGGLSNRAFAFDGTVLRIVHQGSGVDPDRVLFRVRQWFRGGHAARVIVQMMGSPKGTTWRRDSEFTPPHPVGARLLVTGEPRWGGPPLRHAYAWGCGFTVRYRPAEAAVWHDTFDPVHEPAKTH